MADILPLNWAAETQAHKYMGKVTNLLRCCKLIRVLMGRPFSAKRFSSTLSISDRIQPPMMSDLSLGQPAGSGSPHRLVR
jgi:hypothetical protein